MSNILNVLNTIRANSSELYQERIPQATRENIQTIGNQLLKFTETRNEFCSALIERIAMTLVNTKTLNNPLQKLKKGGIPLGKGIQELYTNITSGDVFDPEGTDLLKRKKPDIKTLYHTMNRENQYTVTITREQLKTAFIDENSLNKLLNDIVTSLYSSSNYDDYMLMNKLLSSAVDNKVSKEVSISSTDTTRELLKGIKKISKKMTFPSSSFNCYAEKYLEVEESETTPVITWTPTSDQILIIDSDVMCDIDVDVLAGVFHIEKSELPTQILELDCFNNENKQILAMLIDKNFVQVYDNLQEMTNFYNPKGLYHNYYLTHFETLSLSSLANSVTFVKETV